MINYRISGENNEIIDFKKALMDIKLDNSDEYCLISNVKLETDHVKLDCGHKFNYKSIFSEVKNQKRYSHLETQKLKREVRTVNINLLNI